jgi:hypothetical protein
MAPLCPRFYSEGLVFSYIHGSPFMAAQLPIACVAQPSSANLELSQFQVIVEARVPELHRGIRQGEDSKSDQLRNARAARVSFEDGCSS